MIPAAPDPPALIVKAFQIGTADQLHQITITGLVLAEKYQVIHVVVTACFPVQAAAGGNVDFTADDRLDAFFTGLPEKSIAPYNTP
jgi:hypothetical protein